MVQEQNFTENPSLIQNSIIDSHTGFLETVRQLLKDREQEIQINKETYKVYISMLDNAITNPAETFLPNSGKEHASWMFAKMFDAVQSEVMLVVRDFSGDVSNRPEYLSALMHCLENKSIPIKVVVIERPNSDSKAYNLLYEYYKGNVRDVKIRIGKPGVTDKIISTNLKIENKVGNFAVFDDMYRIETDPDSFSAIGGFHDHITSTKLKNLFLEVYKSAEDA